MLLAIFSIVLCILVLIIAFIKSGLKVTIVDSTDTSCNQSTFKYDFILLGDVYIQVDHIQSIFVNKHDKSIEIKTDNNRYFYRYVDADEFIQALNELDEVMNTNIIYNHGL